LRYQDLLPLQQAGVDYLALGHIHKHYALEGWIFNPGSLEANSTSGNQEQNPRGVYLVTLDALSIQAQLKRDFHQRRILRLTLHADSRQTQSDLEQSEIALIQ
jgi:DNA repair protein SbcD/Mre11